MDKLKPCPFCDEQASFKDFDKPFKNGWVGCKNCHCFINWIKDGKREAIEAWNRRAEPDQEGSE